MRASESWPALLATILTATSPTRRTSSTPRAFRAIIARLASAPLCATSVPQDAPAATCLRSASCVIPPSATTGFELYTWTDPESGAPATEGTMTFRAATWTLVASLAWLVLLAAPAAAAPSTVLGPADYQESECRLLAAKRSGALESGLSLDPSMGPSRLFLSKASVRELQVALPWLAPVRARLYRQLPGGRISLALRSSGSKRTTNGSGRYEWLEFGG